MMKVLQVISGIDPASGGPTRSCKGLCRALSQAGVDVTLLVLGGHHPFENPSGVKICYAADEVEKIGGGGEWRVADFDLVHLQGLWNPKLHAVVKQCRRANVPYVISPRGMLDPWALSVKKWKKRLAMFLYQRGDLKHAAAFHATAELEASNIRAQGLKQPIIIAANGVEVPRELPEVKAKGEGEQRTAIFLSRLHPGKGLLTLAEAWARVKPKGWVMRVVGPDSYGHKAEVVAKLDALGILEQWQFVDMVDDVKKWQEYASAELLVHPSVSENFGITIAEGLYAGLPVVCTKGTPWKDVEDWKCGRWIDVGVEPLAVALRQLLNATTAQLSEMGANGRKLVEEKYLWPAIGRSVKSAYEEILKGRR